MKKLTILALAFLALGVTSCKRDWSCKCTSSVGGSSATTESTFKATKGDAEDACSALEVSAGGASTTCELSKK